MTPMHPTRPRVAIVFEYGTLNGGERSMLAALDALPKGTVDVAAIAPPGGPLAEALRSRGIVHTPLEFRAADGTHLSRERVAEALKGAVLDLAPDIVHANSLAMGRLTGAIAPELPMPTVAHLRDILHLSRAAVADLNRNTLLLAVSAATREFHAAQGLRAERVRVLYNGVDCRLFQPGAPGVGAGMRRPQRNSAGGSRWSTPATREPLATKGWLRTELRLPQDAFLVATIGQISLRKGQDVLAEAAALLGPQFPEMHFVLVGERHSAKRESIEFEQAVMGRFTAAGLGRRLHRLGYRDDVARLLNEIDLLVHPAHQEPLGRVLLEAAAAELPIVATAVGGTAEILTDGVSARLVPPGQPAKLAAAISELLQDAEMSRRFAAAARDRVCTAFDIADRAADLAAVWRELCGVGRLS
jgi:glycosyltransferase involved in cell wall biosynthesis